MSIPKVRRHFLMLAIALPVALVTGGAAWAEAVFTGSTPGVAINGYDPVGYFTEGKPITGTEEHTSQWNGVTWRFSSASNKSSFDANPEKYAPQYGGYCAYAVAKNAKAKTVPEAFSIVGDKLYLNFSLGVRSRWEADTNGYIKQADANWPGLK